MDWFLYDIGLRRERVKKHLQLEQGRVARFSSNIGLNSVNYAI